MQLLDVKLLLTILACDGLLHKGELEGLRFLKIRYTLSQTKHIHFQLFCKELYLVLLLRIRTVHILISFATPTLIAGFMVTAGFVVVG